MMKFKKTLSLFLALVMCLGLVNFGAFADTTEGGETIPSVEEVPAVVQTFLDAVDALPESVTEENADEVAVLVDACEAAYGALSEDDLAREDVMAAIAKMAALVDSGDDPEPTEPAESENGENKEPTEPAEPVDGEDKEPEDKTNLLDDENDVAKIGDTGFTTLQNAINAAKDGDTVVLQKDVTENVTITSKKITLDLNSKTVNGGGNGTVLTINGGNVTLTGDGTITGGNGGYYGQGGGLLIKGKANVTMDGCSINENHVRQQGGGVFIDEGTFTLKSGSITNNSAGSTGGGVFVYNYMQNKSARFVMNGGTISGNTANGGAGVGAYGWKMNLESPRIVAELNSGTIENNVTGSSGNGGGVAMECGDVPSYITAQYGATGMNTIKINGVTIRGNHANQGGGVWGCDSNLVLNGTIIKENSADKENQNYGGGVYVQGGSATITDAEITGNTAAAGGGIFAGHKLKDTVVAMTGGKLYGNTASSHSADVYCNATTTLTLPDASTMGGKLNGKAITGWYLDNEPRWDEGDGVGDGISSGYYSYETIPSAEVHLIAAYTPDPVAKIVRDNGDVLCYTLQAAIDAAENGETVEVMKDTVGASLQEAKSITVDIPANVTVKTVTGKTYAIAVAGDGAELTLTGAGTIEGGTYGAVAQSKGTLNVNGCTVTAAGGTGTITKNGKKVKVTVSRAINAATGGTVNVSGGTIFSADKDMSNVIYATGTDTTVNVSGGTVTCGAKQSAGYYTSTSGISLVNGAKAVVSGEATVTGGYTGISLGANTALKMSGGNVSGTGFGISGNGTADGTVIEISGGRIEGAYTALYHPQVGDMTISGGTFTGPNGVQYSGAGNLTITGGSITATLPYTEAPQKPETQHDGTVSDGAALSIVSRGAGYQDTIDGQTQTMNVTITGGTFTSEHNSAVAVYRIKKISGNWTVGNATGLDSYLGNLTIKEGENGSVPVFVGADEKPVLDIEAPAMDAKSITGGTFSQDIDAGEINYVDEGYASHEIATGYAYAGYFNVHQPVADRADCVTCTPSGGGSNPNPNPGSGGGGTNIEDEDPPLANVDGNLNTTDHYAYIIGRGENCVQPLENITRAEVATIFFRLLTEDFRVANWSTVSSFPDVEAGAWYATEIATAERAGILKGCDDGNMQPDRDITRAEFTVMAIRFLNGSIEDDGVGDFADTADHWAAKEIRLAAKAGWIKGYGNNFRPNDPITRAEAMTIINRMLDRVPGETFPAGVIEWEDNPKGAWYYADVMEATNGHDYEREEGSVVEKWTALTPYRDWIALEAEWTANNGASAPASEEK